MSGLSDTEGLALGEGLSWLGGGLGGAGLDVETVPAVYMGGATTMNITSLQGTPSGLFSMSMWFNSHYVVVPGQSRSRWTTFQANGKPGRPGGSTVYTESDGTLFFYFRDTSPGNGNGRMWFTTDPTELNTWNHILISIDTSGGSYVWHLYINDQLITMDDGFEDGSLPFNLDILANTFYLQDWMLVGDTQPAIMDVYDPWIANGQFIDFSVEANRRKFITAGGAPVDLGPTGLLPTGVAPTVFFHGGPGAFPTNRGTGGAFTLTGPLVAAATAPTIAGEP